MADDEVGHAAGIQVRGVHPERILGHAQGSHLAVAVEPVAFAHVPRDAVHNRHAGGGKKRIGATLPYCPN